MPLVKEDLNYRVEGIAGFEGLRVSELSNWLTYSAAKLGILVSAAEAAAVIACSGNAERYLTRTTVIGFKHDNQWYLAFDDISDAQQNICLAHADNISNYGYIILQKSDKLVQSAE